MKHLNFLDNKRDSGFKFELNYFWILASLIIATLLFLGYGQIISLIVESYQKQITEMSSQISQLSTQQDSQRKKIEDAKALNNVLNRPTSWSAVLKQLAQIMPPTIHITHLKGSLAGDRRLIIEGTASYYRAILELKTNLDSVPQCKNINLNSFGQEGTEQAQGHINFQLECEIQ